MSRGNIANQSWQENRRELDNESELEKGVTDYSFSQHPLFRMKLMARPILSIVTLEGVEEVRGQEGRRYV